MNQEQYPSRIQTIPTLTHSDMLWFLLMPSCCLSYYTHILYEDRYHPRASYQKRENRPRSLPIMSPYSHHSTFHFSDFPHSSRRGSRKFCCNPHTFGISRRVWWLCHRYETYSRRKSICFCVRVNSWNETNPFVLSEISWDLFIMWCWVWEYT